MAYDGRTRIFKVAKPRRSRLSRCTVAGSGDDDTTMGARKADHIRICLDEASQFDQRTTGLDGYWLVHDALPEMAPQDVDLGTEFLGKALSAPLMVSSMTGGPVQGATINRNLGEAVQAAGLAMGVGSQRIAIAEPVTASSFEVRRWAPDIPLLANIGAVQLNYGFGEAECRRAVEMIGADGLFLHLNSMQEVVQPEGDTNFRGLLEKIGALVEALPFPVLLKECGAGVSADVLSRVWKLGVAAVDVSGAGGTSWTRVEAHRSSDPLERALGETFGNWGIPTAVAVREGRAAVPDAVIIASGGIRTGVDAAKALALGADMVSIAKPVLAAALESGEAVTAVLERFKTELRLACFGVGARSVAELRTKPILRRW